MQYDRKLVYRAGVIPYFVDDDGEILMKFMRPSNPEYGGDDFQIAKGRVEDGEDHRFAALREGQEELGLFISNISETEEVGVFMGRTTIYVSKIKRKDMFGEPGFETSDVAWMTIDEFNQTGRDLHRPVVRAAYSTILRMEERAAINTRSDFTRIEL